MDKRYTGTPQQSLSPRLGADIYPKRMAELGRESPLSLLATIGGLLASRVVPPGLGPAVSRVRPPEVDGLDLDASNN
jgi:hypothetical protein